MPRYAKGYRGERRSRPVTIKLTPTEHATFAAAAEEAGATVSQFGRERCLLPTPRNAQRRAGSAIAAHRDPYRAVLLRELTAIGNNLNQLARISNTMHSAPQLAELKETTAALKAIMAQVVEGP